MENLTTFAQRLKKVMRERDLNQKQLAKLIDVQPATISAYLKNAEENGNGKNPSLSIAIEIAKKCNISLDWLCGLSGDNDEPINSETRIKTVTNAGNKYPVVEVLNKVVDLSFLFTKMRVKSYGLPEGQVTALDPDVKTVTLDIDSYGIRPIADFIESYMKLKKLHEDGSVDESIMDAFLQGELVKHKNEYLEQKDDSIRITVTKEGKKHAKHNKTPE